MLFHAQQQGQLAREKANTPLPMEPILNRQQRTPGSFDSGAFPLDKLAKEYLQNAGQATGGRLWQPENQANRSHDYDSALSNNNPKRHPIFDNSVVAPAKHIVPNSLVQQHNQLSRVEDQSFNEFSQMLQENRKGEMRLSPFRFQNHDQ